MVFSSRLHQDPRPSTFQQHALKGTSSDATPTTPDQGDTLASHARAGQNSPSVSLRKLAVGAMLLGAKAAAGELGQAVGPQVPNAGRRMLQQYYCGPGEALNCIPCPTNPTAKNDPCNVLPLLAPVASPPGFLPYTTQSVSATQSAAASCVYYGMEAGTRAVTQGMDLHFCLADTQSALQALKQTDATGVAMTNPAGWLEVQGNHFLLNGHTWRGHGINIVDTTFGGMQCTTAPINSAEPGQIPASEAARAAEINRRIDLAIGNGANYVRLLLDPRPWVDYTITTVFDSPNQSRLLTDASFMNSIESIVNHVSSKDGVFIDLTLFTNPAGINAFSPIAPLDTSWLPTSATNSALQKLATQFANNPRVIFGLANEPYNKNDGASLQTLNAAVLSNIDAIRQAEQAAGAPGEHLIKVPCLTVGGLPLGRDLSWWGQHPIARSNVIYSLHPYEDHDRTMNTEILPFRSLPIIVDEFGPAQTMNISHALAVAASLEEQSPPIPYAPWVYWPGTGLGLLQATPATSDPCNFNATLSPTPQWGASYLNWLSGVKAGLSA